MGAPRKQRRKYSTPTHPWEAVRIEEERELLKEYGLKNKKEIWKPNSLLRKYKTKAKKLVALNTEQAKKEKQQILKRLQNYGLLKEEASLDDVLGLNVRNILDRRLQTIVFKKGLTKSVKQARQLIVHRHVSVGARKINVPSYMVHVSEEGIIAYAPESGFNDEMHPERQVKEKKPKKQREPRKQKKGRRR